MASAPVGSELREGRRRARTSGGGGAAEEALSAELDLSSMIPLFET
jgi:hypothetical protein